MSTVRRSLVARTGGRPAARGMVALLRGVQVGAGLPGMFTPIFMMEGN